MEMTPLRGHPILSGPLGASLAEEEYRRAAEAVRRSALELSHPALDFSDFRALLRSVVKLYGKIRLSERAIRPRLRDLAVEVVAEAHALGKTQLESLIQEAAFSEPGELGIVGARTVPNQSAIVVERVRSAVARRRTHNAIIQGLALDHMCRGLALAKTPRDRLSPGMFLVYQLFSNLAVLLHFVAPFGLSGCARSGISGVHWDDTGGVKIWARADCFPVLLQEISKGLLELFVSHGLPRPGALTHKEAGEFQRHAEDELHEPLYFMMGPALARRLNRALVSDCGVMRYGATSDPGMDLAHTWALLSLLPEDELHTSLSGLLSANEKTRSDAAKKLVGFLRSAQSNYYDDSLELRRSP